MPFDPQEYGPLFAPRLVGVELNALGPGHAENSSSSARRSRRDELNSLSLEAAFAPRAIRDRNMAECCLAGLWLLHDELDLSHRISQSIETTSGSFWHGIMHRREPDYENAKYWFRRVGNHPIFEPLNIAARELIAAARGATAKSPPDSSARFLGEQAKWDPYRFIDLCEAASSGRSSSEPLCREIQRVEWELLFDYCFRRAVDDERPARQNVT